jgi:hypothetical protein
MPSLGLYQDSFDSRKRAVLDSHSIADLQERPRFARQSCTDNCLESFDLFTIDRSRELGAADDVLNAGNTRQAGDYKISNRPNRYPGNKGARR